MERLTFFLKMKRAIIIALVIIGAIRVLEVAYFSAVGGYYGFVVALAPEFFIFTDGFR